MSSSTPNADYDSVVVGGGLVGAALAALIAQRFPKWRVALFDVNRPKPLAPDQYDSKVIALSLQACGLLREVGVLEQLQPWACSYQDMVVWDAEGTGRISFSAEQMQIESLGEIVESGRILTALWNSLSAQSNLDILCPVRIVGLSNSETETEENPNSVTTLELDDGRLLTTRLVCAVDGANSTVRELLKLPTKEWSYNQSALVATITTEKPHQETCWQRFMPTGPLAFLPLNHPDETENRCSIVWSLDEQQLDEINALDDQQICARLTRESESILGEVVAIEGRVCFPLRQRHATDYVRPGAALVGDSAHTIHPLAGQGANLGFQDVETLLQELERAERRGLEPGEITVLQRYQRQRKTENLAMMVAMEGFKRLFGSDEIGLRWLRNKALKKANELPDLKQLFVRQASAVDPKLERQKAAR